LLDYDHLLVFDNLGFDFLLLAGLQVPCTFGFLAHALDCIHHIVLLRQKGIAEIGGPLNVFR
jgi:hypothetical protein